VKIQCPCGTKYAFEVTPEMAQTPVQFVCQACGLDSSDVVNELIRQELASAATVIAPPPEPAPGPPLAATARVRVQPRQTTESPTGDTHSVAVCPKHPGQAMTHRCLVCQKPICPKCMENFGYVCSPLCKAKAEAQGIAVPVYARQKSVVEARRWRKTGLISGAATAVVVGLLGFWFWYAWFGSVLHPVFSLRFPEAVSSGQSCLSQTNQIIFLHGTMLSRYDIRAKKEIWSRELISKKQVYDAVAQMYEEERIADGEKPTQGRLEVPKLLRWDKILEQEQRDAEASLKLHVRGRSIWVREPVSLRRRDWKLVRCDWDTGKPLQELLPEPGLTKWSTWGDEMLLSAYGSRGRQAVVHINLVSGAWRIDKFGLLPEVETSSSSGKAPDGKPAGAASKGQEMAGLPTGVPGKDRGKALDPAKVAQDVQNLPLADRIALPASLSSQLHQERILAELDDEPEPPPRARRASGPGQQPLERAAAAAQARAREEANLESIPFTLMLCDDGYIQLGVRLLEKKLLTRTAMKAPPAKSVLDGNLTVDKTADLANEILNEMQRSRGGDTVTEDQSRYQVTVRRPDRKEVSDWTGEVIGSPSLFPLRTVSVIAAGKTIVVLDKTNKKLWQGTNSYEIVGRARGLNEEDARFGQGPCAEHGDALYVIDEAVLSAFDLQTGKVRWRLPSVGVQGLFFDDAGELYLNTTTASPESIKYPRQIDVRQRVSSIVMKVDPRTGKILWTADPGGFIAYVSGKFIYTLQSLDAHEGKEENPYATGLEIPSHVVIRRLNPDTGRSMWVHTQRRAPLDVRFERNTVEMVFKKEVQVLSFLTF
jgi:hypothetical protein